MYSWKKALGFGLVTWLVPFIVAIPFYGPDGAPRVDIHLFKSIMIVVATFVGCSLLVKYFKGVTKDYVKTACQVGWLWFGLNIVLDLLILLPLSGLSLTDYITQIGLRYLMIPIIATAFGYILKNQSKIK